MTWVDALGWFGSALLVFSLLQARILRLRVLNTVACVILVVFNAVLGVWPMVAMNVVLAGINLWFIVRMLRDRGDERAFAVVPVREDDGYLLHVLHLWSGDLARFFPAFTAGTDPSRSTWLVQHGDETAGVIVVRDVGDGTAEVELDYVTPRFRDFAPGEFVFRRSGLFHELGVRRVLTAPGMVAPYYDRLGFTREGDRFRLDLG
ncbi:YgjV family protein [Phycicoccus sp. MAQZ13P-2]|uniref:YgjV family protein n=1 Tax=Phycicoccus mangrovi TaxID=2840470 RepID=UPI001C002EC4|nr:YgjV family protein [Phycicoccus mangrovi]MBT9255842.1 YgjV family protein [Phycicoccus mangrovi]MBT9274436.1 YgjV family protein [Phycicoccus mangrovi]